MNWMQLTNEQNAPQGCVPRTYPYWSQINNHAGQAYLYVFVGRRGANPLLLRVQKSSLEVQVEGELPPGEGEGWYFSSTTPGGLYMLQGNQLLLYDIFNGSTSVVFTLRPEFGDGLWQAHSSDDDRTHSATVVRNGERVGCVVVRDGQQTYIAVDNLDECAVDKSGQHLVIKSKDKPGDDGKLENRILDIERDVMSFIPYGPNVIGHSDCGHGFEVGEAAVGDSWRMVKRDLSRPLEPPQTMFEQLGSEWGSGMGSVAVRGQAALVSRPDALLFVPLDGSRSATEIVPSFMSGAHGTDYDYMVRACWDPTGEFCLWLADHGSDRLDAFLARVSASHVDGPYVPSPVPTTPVPPNQPVPEESRMKQLPIFTRPEDTHVELQHDNGQTFVGVSGTADGRPAHLIPLDDNLPEGNGARLVVTKEGFVSPPLRGRLWLRRGDRPEFAVDDIELVEASSSFR